MTTRYSAPALEKGLDIIELLAGRPGALAQQDIAGIVDARGRVLGLMPHPERAADPQLGGSDGAAMFQGLVEALA